MIMTMKFISLSLIIHLQHIVVLILICENLVTSQVLSTTEKGTNLSEHPWHAGLYKKLNNDEEYTRVCGASILTPEILITAAYCVTSSTSNKEFDPKTIKVAVGKIRLPWSQMDPDEQRFDITSVEVPQLYQGHVSSFEYDVALLKLSKPIQLTENIKPISYNWDEHNKFTIKNGINGTVVGRDVTKDGRDFLSLVHFSVLDRESCMPLAEKVNFNKFLTADKFCGRRANGNGKLLGEGGGAFAVNIDGQSHLIGTTSIKPVNSDEFVVFTDLNNPILNNWIHLTRDKFTPK